MPPDGNMMKFNVLQCKDKIDKDKAIISRDENMNILTEKMHVSVSIFTNIYTILCICVQLQNITYSYLLKGEKRKQFLNYSK